MRPGIRIPWPLLALVAVSLLARPGDASIGDRLPEFRECVEVCTATNCHAGGPEIPLHHRLLLWTCPAECDYTCQHITTAQRLARLDPPYLSPVVQYHGKWPFYRFLGMQEPFSVLFSLFNYLAHSYGLSLLRTHIPATYPLRPYYLWFGYIGLLSWIFSMGFHTRDSSLSEKLDYFGAGANVLYQLYYTPIRIFRLDTRSPRRQSVLRFWTVLCGALYVAHVAYLSLWRWDYTYNMAANVGVGIAGNLMWSAWAIYRYRKVQKTWAVWPGLIVAWIVMAMGLELFDFPPWGGMVDAHCLWHLGTVVPTVWWYKFLVKDAQEDLQTHRLKN